MLTLDIGQGYIALMGPETQCGDVGLIKCDAHVCIVALMDGLGHGVEARAAAVMARDYIEAYVHTPIEHLISGMHERLKGSRGVVAALLKINMLTGEMTYSGMGNIAVKHFGMTSTTFVAKDGVIGYLMSTPTARQYTLLPGDIILMHSDGIRVHFQSHFKHRWTKMPAQAIVDEILVSYRTALDDASCIVIKCINSKEK